MRLFIALEIPEDTKRALLRSARAVEKLWRSGRLNPPESYHMTLVFLGEVPPDRLGEVTDAMDKCPSPPLEIALGGFGLFGERRGGVLWRKAESGNALYSLHRRLCRELSDRGFSLERREYSPHVTLGRKVVLPDGLSLPAPEAVGTLSFTAAGMTLLRTEQGGPGPAYTPLYRRAFDQKGENG